MEFQPIPLSPEQKTLLESPVSDRVDRILKEIYVNKAAAERAIKFRRIIQVPVWRFGHKHAIQDQGGAVAPARFLNQERIRVISLGC